MLKTLLIQTTYDVLAFKQTVDIQIGTNCAPLSADLSLYTYEAEILKN
jgi:hypothetical protein